MRKYIFASEPMTRRLRSVLCGLPVSLFPSLFFLPLSFQINTGDVEEVDALFHDAKASAQLLADDAEGYLH